MKFEAKRDPLLEALSRVTAAVSKRSTLEVLKHVNLVTGENCLQLTATNLELLLETTVFAVIEEDGGINLPHKLLSDVIAGIQDEDLVFTSHECKDKEYVTITSPTAQVMLEGIKHEDFPAARYFSITDVSGCFSFNGGWLKSRIHSTAFSVADDSTRPALNNIRCVIAGRRFLLASTDGFRLSVWEEELAEPLMEESRELLIPAALVTNVLALMDDEEMVTATINCQKLVLETARIKAIINIPHADFPDYIPVIPKDYRCALYADAKQLRQAARLASIISNHKEGISLKYESSERDKAVGSLHLGGLSSNHKGTAVCDRVGCDPYVEDVDLGVNGNYFVEALDHAPGIPSLHFVSRDAPLALKVKGDNCSWLHLIMPMHVSKK